MRRRSSIRLSSSIPTTCNSCCCRGKFASVGAADRDALATYYRILGNDPENPQAILRLASIEMRRGRAEQAVPLLRQLAMSSEGRKPEILREARLSLVDAYAKRERWDEAASLLGEIAGGEALSNDLQYKPAYVRFRAGLSNEARQSLAEFLKCSASIPAVSNSPDNSPLRCSTPPLPCSTKLLPNAITPLPCATTKVAFSERPSRWGIPVGNNPAQTLRFPAPEPPLPPPAAPPCPFLAIPPSI